MKPSRLLALAAAAAIGASVLTVTPSFAADATNLTVHYYKPGGDYQHAITTAAVGGTAGQRTDSSVDDFGSVDTFTFPGEQADAYLGFTMTEDAAFPDDRRIVRADGGTAEAWVVDGDARAYEAPQLIDPSLLVKRDRKAYVAVEDLTDLVGLTFSYGKNGYLFDGAATGTADILTVHRDRDYFEIDVNRDRIGSNVTGNMLNDYTDLVFDDVDGFAEGGKYYLSFGAVEKLFQVRTLVKGDSAFLLHPQFAAHDQLETADPESVGFSPDKLAELDDYIQAQVDDGGPAVAVVVTKDGKVVKNSAYGYAKKYGTTVVDGEIQPATLLPESEWEPATTDTLFDLASNSKMYATNYAIQRLVSQGELDLDRTLQSFPGWQNFTDADSVYTGKWTVGGPGGITAVRTGKETVTIRDILHHNGGLIPDPEYPNRASAGDLWYQTDDADDRTGIIDVISKTPLMYTPRTTFAYSDVDFMILGLLVEQITGKRLDQYLQDEFYGPLGLEHTMYRPLDHGIDPSQIAATELNGNTRDGNISFGALPDGSPVPMRHYTLQGEVHDEKAYYSMAGVAGHAGLFSNTADMAVLTQLMLNGGIYGDQQFFSQDVAQQFTTPFSLNPATVDSATIGLGWRVHSKSASAYYYFNWGPSRSTYGHQGWTGTLTIIDPLNQMTITILTNMRHSPVVSPPNGFEGAQYPVADLVPISAHVYRALNGESTQYNPIASVSPVDGVTVANGTSEQDAIAALSPTTSVTDADGATHTVGLSWALADYDASTAGRYDAVGRFSLPVGVTQSDPETELSVTATVTVEEAAVTLPTVPPTGPGTSPGSDPGAPDSTGGAQASGGDLANTGLAIGGWAALALLAAALGAAILVRRRRASH
ncbi:penicillin binding protein PBP4B [Herbiconiux sp. CPCC 205763]|uniref:Penicillin binding protein PBP4B n=1 Tax=Herbiconiux aconitum TaxID=2970913 RepID=A0ABT2GS93_9MICO|nr:penicillin binding protein PBP4B [Herbiconiux aconitum]MCS5717784.1 penicillin binding protein PBP4B [Herbiconiux aconitum]